MSELSDFPLEADPNRRSVFEPAPEARCLDRSSGGVGDRGSSHLLVAQPAAARGSSEHGGND